MKRKYQQTNGIISFILEIHFIHFDIVAEFYPFLGFNKNTFYKLDQRIRL